MKTCMFLVKNLSQTTQHFQNEKCFLEKLCSAVVTMDKDVNLSYV